MNLALLRDRHCWCLDTRGILKKQLEYFTDDWTRTPTESPIPGSCSSF